MNALPLQIFFSCSFSPEDKETNELFLALCRGLDMKCVNVSEAYSATPPAKAKELIAKSQAVVVVATRREKLQSGEFRMPTAVHDELSMAYGLGIPILAFVETGVKTDGFLPGYATIMEWPGTCPIVRSGKQTCALNCFCLAALGQENTEKTGMKG
jgi:hypothetical protein